MSNTFDPSTIRLTPKDRLEIDEGTTHGEYAESLITAQLRKTADWMKSLEHEDRLNVCHDHDCSMAEVQWLVDKLREAAGE